MELRQGNNDMYFCRVYSIYGDHQYTYGYVNNENVYNLKRKIFGLKTKISKYI